MRRFFVLCAALAAFHAAAPSAKAVSCHMSLSVGISCDSTGCRVLTWSHEDTCPGGGPTFTVERRCCPDGQYTVIATGVTGDTYTDCTPFLNCKTLQYQVSINCAPCSCTGYACSAVTNCFTCP
jgi:hypothetical protein